MIDLAGIDQLVAILPADVEAVEAVILEGKAGDRQRLTRRYGWVGSASASPNDWHLACMGTSKHDPPVGELTDEGRPSRVRWCAQSAAKAKREVAPWLRQYCL